MSQDYELKIQYFLRRSTLWNSLNEVYLLCKLHISSFSMTKDIYIFKLVILLTLSCSKLILILMIFGMSKLTLLVPFFWFWTGQFAALRQNIRVQKQSKPTPFFNDSIRRNQELGSLSINRIKRFNLLFLFVTCFSDYAS